MIVNNNYVPDRGDLVGLEFSPQKGHEQSGHRPAVCVSLRNYNEIVGLALFCPITSKIKGYPFEVKLPENININGVILADQIKSLDYRRRNAKFIFKLPHLYLNEVIGKLNTLLS